MWIIYFVVAVLLFLMFVGLSLRVSNLETRQAELEELLKTNDRLLQATLIDEFKNERNESGNRPSLDPPD